MRLISARSWALVVLSAVLQMMAFPIAGPLPVWRSYFGWICLVPLVLALLAPAADGRPLTWKQGFYLGYLCGFLWYLGNCYWIYQTMFLYGGLPKIVSLGILILFALYLGSYHALFAMLLRWVHNAAGRLPAILLIPFLWVAVELARARITGFPWDLLGYSQVDNLLLTRLAPVMGVMGISFIIAAVNAVFIFSAMSQAKQRYVGGTIALAFVAATGLAFLHSVQPGNSTANQSAVMMQENLEVGAQGRTVIPLSEQQELSLFPQATRFPAIPEVRDGVKSFHPTDAGVSDEAVVIWPEAPSHFRSDDPTFRAVLTALAQKTHAPQIIGSLGVDFNQTSPRGYYLYDSASLFDASGTYHGRYDKIHLVPWGEYVPFKRFFAFAQKLTEGVGDMDPGYKRSVFATGGHSYGVFVCYESIFGDEVRQFAKNGAEVLVNISDDGWYGDTGAPWQHLNMARMRAIENHRWVLRSTNTGVTTAIDPYGQMMFQAPRHVRGAFLFPFDFEPANNLTLYTRFGDWFAWICAFVSIGALGYAATKTPLLKR